jgi:drug/metabolite transporter (DMT)-like permease
MLFMGNGAVTWVEQYLPTGLAAIIVATVPLWFVLLDRRQWSFYFSNRGIIFGLVIGFCGVILLFAGKAAANLFDSPIKIVSLLVLICGTLGWTAGSLYAKYKTVEGSTSMKVGIQMLAAGTAFLIAGLLSGEGAKLDLHAISSRSIGALLYLIFFGSLVGYLAYMWLLSVRPASLVGTYAYVNPVVAVLLGWTFVGEKISTQQMIGLGVIIAGLLIVNANKEKKSAVPKPQPAHDATLASAGVD